MQWRGSDTEGGVQGFKNTGKDLDAEERVQAKGGVLIQMSRLIHRMHRMRGKDAKVRVSNTQRGIIKTQREGFTHKG